MTCCGAAAKWKREVVHDHKFDFIDVTTFYENSLLRKLKYSVIFLLALKATLVYIADLWTAGILLFFNNWQTVQPKIPLEIARYIYLLCILCSFLLLAWDAINARKIIRSRDIGLAYTSPLAYRIYVLRSYAHYCFFSQINNSKKISDDIAFFVFFTLKGWKRIIFAEAPRQVVNGFTIYAILIDNPRKVIDFMGVYAKADINNNPVPFLALCLMAFVFAIFVVSAVLILFASILYLPLLCHIRGNLKEYCCHKIDKRIGEMLKKKSRKRLAREARKEMARALEKKASGAPYAVAEPTLPMVNQLGGMDDAASEYGFAPYDYGTNAYNYPPAHLPVDDYRHSPRIGPMSNRPSAEMSTIGLQRHPSKASVALSAHFQDGGIYRQESGRYHPGTYYPATPSMGPSQLGAVVANRYVGRGRNGSLSSVAGSTVSGRYVHNPGIPPHRGANY